jgi:hypothetical protein
MMLMIRIPISKVSDVLLTKVLKDKGMANSATITDCIKMLSRIAESGMAILINGYLITVDTEAVTIMHCGRATIT